ncbi:hypothetical protein TNCV_1949541 [Trichonephila clavipes]|nr:hypothetical protein TNCV_1949541 [Trichonephila clavipes]
MSVRETAKQVEIRTGSAYEILRNSEQSFCEICLYTSGGTEITPSYSCTGPTDTTNAEPSSLRLLVVPENENAIARILF